MGVAEQQHGDDTRGHRLLRGEITRQTRFRITRCSASGGELLQHIAGRPRLSEAEAYTLFRQVFEAVDYLHTMGVVHRDIKPENILCGKNFENVKIADLGWSKPAHSSICWKSKLSMES